MWKDILFEPKVIILVGDFRQVLAIVSCASRLLIAQNYCISDFFLKYADYIKTCEQIYTRK